MATFTKAEAGEVKAKQLSKENCEIKLSVEANAKLVNKCFEDALVQVQSRAQMQGFRAGKVPLQLVKQNFPSHIKERAIDFIIRAGVAKALEIEKINPVTVPTLTKADFNALEESKPFSFECLVEVAPEFEPKNYTGIKIAKKADTVTDKEVDARIQEILEHNSRLEEDAEGVITDNVFAVVGYDAIKNGEKDFKLSADSELIDMSAPQTVVGLAEAVKGAKKGDLKEFTAKVGEDDVTFKVTVQEIKKKVLPALDETFAKDMGFDSIDALKTKVKETMEKDAKADSERDVIIQIENQLVEHNSFALPKGLVEEQLNSTVDGFLQRYGGQNAKDIPAAQRKELADRMRENVEKDLRIGYLVHAIAKKENIEANEADWQKELDKSLTENKKEEAARIKGFFKDRKEHILATITERKVFDFLKEKAEIK
ncbi:Trigger factor domain [Elusimicrobium minutum Pei191]|uniref:Trigger factor n=1 Tax=Elusimicrobium minutum (strain Pei191) TaxID=445932 RepID=B2KCN1_ELUMP|nr:trigger factor [Elusimicrobium minutum]ACC98277.1 Trigger factor domain [Elusimicrobium minutum Pei191]